MSEEEKEAIEYLEDKYLEPFKKANDSTFQVSDIWTYFKYNDYKSLKLVLNLIDRLQEKIIQISEICIDESKCHISTKDAIEKIRRVI